MVEGWTCRKHGLEAVLVGLLGRRAGTVRARHTKNPKGALGFLSFELQVGAQVFKMAFDRAKENLRGFSPVLAKRNHHVIGMQTIHLPFDRPDHPPVVFVPLTDRLLLCKRIRSESDYSGYQQC